MLFKILHGDASRISTDITPYHEGYCYVTYDGEFYVDMNNERVKLSAKDAETLTGKTLEEIKTSINYNDLVNKPTKISTFTNDAGYLTSYTETDPTVPSWAKASTKPTYTASEVGADISGTAENKVSEHNENVLAHSDIREQISQLSSEIVDIKTYVTPQMFGAKADGVTDDTDAIQAAFDSLTDGGTIYFPSGKYILQHSNTMNGGDYVAISAEGKQGIKVIFDNGATIKHNLTTVGRYTMFRFFDCDGLEICGGVIEGERNEHPDVVTGYGSKGLHIRNCDNVYIHDMEIWNVFGDSIGLSGTTKQCENILVENCAIHDCYRNGISVGGVKRGIIRNCHIYDISGNAPEAGIDIEAEYGYNNEDITVEGCYIHDCVQNTIAFSSNSYNLKVRDCILDGETQGQTTSDNIEIINTTVTGIVKARNNLVLRNCTVQGLSAFDSVDYQNVSVKAYDTIFKGNATYTTFNIGNINGKASLYFKDCELNRLENSSYALFYSYNASNTDIIIDGGTINLWDNSKLDMPFAQGNYSSFKMVGCNIVAKSATISKSLLSVNALDIDLIDCNIDMSEVVTNAAADIAAFGATVNNFNCHGNTFVTNATTQWIFNLSAFVGNAYITQNTAPTINNLLLANTSGGTVFARSNTTAQSVEFTTDDKYKIDNLERGADGKSAYEIYVENGGTLSQTEWLASIASVAPTYASSVEEMVDTSKVYIGSEGTLWGQVKQETIVNENVFDPSKAIQQSYLNPADGALVTTGNAAFTMCTTDYLPFDGSDANSYIATYINPKVIRISANYSGIAYYDENKNLLQRNNLRSEYKGTSTYFVENDDGTVTLELNKFLNGSSISSSIISATRFIRISFYASATGSPMIPEEIKDVKIYFDANAKSVYQYQWTDTGVPYAHYALTDNDYIKIAEKAPEWAKGEQGESGRGIVAFHYIQSYDTYDLYEIEYTDNTYGEIQIPKGDEGADGVGISTIREITGISETETVLDIELTNEATTTVRIPNGADGKSAYKYAQESGYEGTEEEFTEDINPDNINSFIATELAKRGQLKPEFVQTVEECTDTTKLYVLPDGMIWAYMFTEVKVGGYTNLINTADSEFKTKSRINDANSVASASNANAFVSNFITAQSGQIIRIKGVTSDTSSGTSPLFKILFCKEDNSSIIAVRLDNVGSGAYFVHELVEISEDGVYKYQLGALANGTTNSYATTLAKIRVSGVATNGIDNVIVTLDEEIIEPTIVKEYRWASTGHAFVPADYEDRIVDLEAEDAEIREEIAAAKAETDGAIADLQEQIDSGAASAKSGARWFALGDSITEGYTSAVDASATSGYKSFLNTNVTQRWVNIVAEKNGYQLTNYGVGGTGYYHATSNAKVQVNGIDFSKCDFVTLAYGCNDWKYDGSVIGTEADIPQTVVASYNAHNTIKIKDDTASDCLVYKNGVLLTPTTDYSISGGYLRLTADTVINDMFDIYNAAASMVGNMAYCIKKILRDNPYCKIFVITPINCRSYGTYATNWGINYAGTAGSGKPLEYVYEMQKAVCDEYGIELIDMTHSSIVNRENIRTMLADYVHPTVECHAVMARELARKINFM